MKEIHNGDFEREVLRAERPVLADFKAPWCGYCRRLAPVMDRLEKEYGDKISFVGVDTDENPALADEYGVDTIPTLILFREGGVVGKFVNPPSQGDIVDWKKKKNAL